MDRTSVNILAGGKEFAIRGNIPLYLEWHNLWNSDGSALAQAAADLPAGALVVDVGANIGMLTCSLALLRPDLRILAIEPVPSNFRFLSANVEAHGLKNVRLLNAAVGDQDGRAFINDNGPWSSVLDDGPIGVQAISLDSILTEDVALIKIDVEGHEPHVLAGAKSTIAKSRPLILMELNTLLLLTRHYDPMSFSQSIWDAYDVLCVYHNDVPEETPDGPINIIARNIVQHGSVSDLLLRPKYGAILPTLDEMTCSPQLMAMRARNPRQVGS